MKQISLVIATLILFFLSNLASAQVTPSLEFLTIGAGAKHLTIGDATTAIPIDGLNAMVNPASIAGLTSSSMSANYTVWMAGTQIRSFSAVLTEPKQRLSFSFLSNSTGDIEIRNTPGEPLSTANLEYLALTAAYSYTFVPEISIGVSASYINEQYVTNFANGYSIGLGLFSQLFDGKVRFGAAINHLGEMQKLNERKSQLPAQFRMGTDADIVNLRFPGKMELPLLFSVTLDYVRFLQELDFSPNDMNIIRQNQILTTGIRVLAANMISLQTGYRFLTDESRSAWSFGLGVSEGSFNFDFAFLPFETGFNPGYSIGMRYQF